MKQKQLGWGVWFVIGLVAVLATTTQAALTVVGMAGGQEQTVFVMSDGSLWGMGDEGLGQLGQGFGLTQTNVPIQIVSNSVVTAVACGEAHTMFVESDGSLWAMGADDQGQLGDGTNVTHYFPEKVVSSAVNGVAAGDFHSLYRTSVGSRAMTVSLLGMGDNQFGALGNATNSTKVETPVVIQSTPILSDEVVSFAGGYDHTLFAELNGELWALGYNSNGQLGNGGTMNEFSPVEIETNDVVAVAAGSFHSLFLKSDGELWAMGENVYGDLGDGTQTERHSPEQVGANVTTISAGYGFSLYIKTDGSLWGMGENDFGQLGDGAATNQFFPVQIVASNVVAIAAGNIHSLFLKSDGSLWGMGLNENGQLGDGTYINRYAPIRIVPPPPSPVLTHVSISGTNVTLTATNGLLGATYYVVTSTNMALPVSQWTAVSTNQLSGDGNFTIIATNAVIPAARQQFFCIQLVY
jgi:alpha-tubulin suppressor-like RCC1 family protein